MITFTRLLMKHHSGLCLKANIFDVSYQQENNNVLFVLTVWVLFWLKEMDSISSLGMSLLRRVRVLSILISLLFWPHVWPSFLSLSGLHDLLGSDLTIASEWSVLLLNMQYYQIFVPEKISKDCMGLQDLLWDRHWPSTSEAESATGCRAIPHRQRTRHGM